MIRHDVVVVGGRVAGASTALLLARAGVRVILVDRDRHGSDTLSTHGLMRAGVLQLSRWGILPDVAAAGTPPIRQVIFRYADGEQAAVAIRPSAEAHTFLGWALSYLGRHEDAIAECKTAIEVDADFGNPYNDIGAYLIELGREGEAIAWLERAKRAARYEPRHYPYFNLARVYIKQHKVREAIAELEGAVAIEPGYVLARRELHRLRGMLN